MSDLSADEAWEQEHRVNVDLEPEEALRMLLNSEAGDEESEQGE